MKIIARRLWEERDSLGYSQEGVAKAIGAAQKTPGNWEKRPPRQLIDLRNMVKLFGCSADYILGLTDKRNPEEELETLLEENAPLPRSRYFQQFVRELIAFVRVASDSDFIAVLAFLRVFKEIKEGSK